MQYNFKGQTQQGMIYVNEELIQNHHPIFSMHFSSAFPSCPKTHNTTILLFAV